MSEPTDIPALLAYWEAQAAYFLQESKKYRTNCNKDQRGIRLGRSVTFDDCARQLRRVYDNPED
jgi:hypothetical protein